MGCMRRLCLTFCLVVPAFCFVIQKRSTEGNRLQDALAVLQRERRRIQEGYGDQNPYDVFDYGSEQMNVDDDVLSRILESGDNDYDAHGQWDDDVRAERYFENAIQKENSVSKAEDVNPSELEDIFDSIKDTKENVKSTEMEPSKTNEDIKETEEIVEDNTEENDKEDASTNEESPVSKQELEDIFGEDDKVEESEEEDGKITTKEVVNKEYLNDYLKPDTSESKTKEKRSQKDALEENDLSKEELKTLLIAMTIKSELEDKENTHLANALNLATKSQLENTNQYLDDEFEELSNAIEAEEMLQVLETGRVPDSTIGSSEQRSEEVLSKKALMRKRDDTQLTDTATRPGEEDMTLSNDEIQSLIDLYGGVDREVEDTSNQWEQGPVEDQEDLDEDAEYQLNPFLRQLMRLYGREELETALRKPKRGYENEQRMNDEESEIAGAIDELLRRDPEGEFGEFKEEQCPAVDHVITNCKFIRSMGVGMDGEALDLCNRHEVCYACGESLGRSSLDCDEGYLTAADELCTTESCRDDAVKLYMLMKDLHQFNPDKVGLCQKSCVSADVWVRYSLLLLISLHIQFIHCSSMCSTDFLLCDINKPYCCGCNRLFQDPFDDQLKYPYSVIAYGGDCADECLINLANSTAEVGSCERDYYDALDRNAQGTHSFGGDIIFDINVSKVKGRAGSTVGEVADGTATRYMVRLARALRISDEAKGSLIGALCYYGNLSMHFDLEDFTNVDDLVNGLYGMNLTLREKAKPHKSFNFIREHYFNDTIYGRRKDNRNVVIVFDDGFYTRQGNPMRDIKFRKSIEQLHKVAEVFVVGVRNGFQRSSLMAIRNWKMIASDPDEDHIITMSLADYNDGRIGEIVHRTLQLLPKTKQT
ncbi:unnamed protein product [Owenia fusiformis]|uniref:VWFA domain-containing protein n=1 Tax=Owenia fusiformis TaxID=6347 RepID=A0A8S4NP20_OWEFU|nr:unnamed protein product [Owenia fusiformis]